MKQLLAQVDWDLVFHISSAAFGLTGLIILLLVWRSGAMLAGIVKHLGLQDPDGRISNKKVLITTVVLAGCIAFISGAAKSVATSSDHDIGNNLVWLFGILLSGAGAHAGIQQKLGGGTPPEARRSSGAIAAPPASEAAQ